MKNLFPYLITTLLAVSPTCAWAQLTGESASIGGSNVLTVPYTWTPKSMIAVGSGNQVLSSQSMAIGFENQIEADFGTIALGRKNYVYANGANKMALGESNFTMGSYLLNLGRRVSTYMSDEDGVGAYASLYVGAKSYSSGGNSLTIGTGNSIPGQYHIYQNYFSAQSCALIGKYLLGMYDNCLVVGTMNSAPVLPIGQPVPLFIIGNGVYNGANSVSSNALVVDSLGNLKAQGIITAAKGGSIPEYTGQ